MTGDSEKGWEMAQAELQQPSLQGGAWLGREIDISFETTPARKTSLNLLRTTLPMKRFVSALKIQRAYRKHRMRRLRMQRRKLSILKRARKALTAALASCYTSQVHRRLLSEVKQISRAKQLLEHGVLVDDV